MSVDKNLASSLREVWSTKKDLRSTLKIPKEVPFNEYINYYPWFGTDIQKEGRVLDFIKERYSVDGVPKKGLDGVGEFIRLSTATQWKDGVLVDVAANVMRLDKDKGLLIEPQRTNIIAWSINQYLEVSDLSYSKTATTNIDGTVTAVIATMTTPRVYAPSGVINFSSPTPLVYTYYSSALVSNPPLFRNTTTATNSTNYTTIRDNHVSGNFFVRSYTDNALLYNSGDVISIYPEGTVSAVGTVITPCAIQLTEGSVETSLIRTALSPTTRAKETLIVPVMSHQVITGDWDAGVTCTLVGGNAVFEGHGYIRHITTQGTTSTFRKGVDKILNFFWPK